MELFHSGLIVTEQIINKHTVVFHDDIDQMTIGQFNRVNKFWMLSDDLGDDFADIDQMHIARLMLVAGDKSKTVRELQNLRILINNIINEVHPGQMAFACLIHSIDGEIVKDYSDDNLKRILKLLDPKVGDVKKKRHVKKSLLT